VDGRAARSTRKTGSSSSGAQPVRHGRNLERVHEGTDVAESKEYGRRFIELTRQYVDRFKSGWQPPKVKGAFTDARSVSVVLGARNRESGLRLVDVADGLHEPTTVAGGSRASLVAPGQGRYLYFVVDRFVQMGRSDERDVVRWNTSTRRPGPWAWSSTAAMSQRHFSGPIRVAASR